MVMLNYKKDSVVVQSNELVEARHTTTPLSTKEQKIILLAISRLKKNDENFNIMEFSVAEIHDLLGLKGKAEYTRTKQTLRNLLSKTIEIPFDNGDYLLSNWFSAIRYHHNDGLFEIEFSSMLKPYLLQLKNSFTLYKLKNILSLGSTHSIRLYELLKKWEKIAEVEYPLEKLKEVLGIKPNQYKEYSNFKMRVLKKAKTDINAKTDIEFSFIEIKKGRKVKAIKFDIKAKEKQRIIDNTVPKFYNALFDKLNLLADGYELSLSGFRRIERIAKRIYTKEEYIEQLERLIEFINAENRLGVIDKPVGLMIHIMEDKEKLYAEGYSPKIENTSSEVVPDWFKDRNRSKEKIKKTKEELEMEEQEKLEMDRILAEISNKNPETVQ